VWAALALASALAAPAHAAGRALAVTSTRAADFELRAWDRQIDVMLRAGDARVREVVRDAMLPNRRHERIVQYVHGVRVVGAEVTRQPAPDGVVSVLGLLHADIDIDTNPRLSAEDGRRQLEARTPGNAMTDAELVVLPLSDGYHLAYYAPVTTGVEIFHVFVDAN